MQEAIYEGKNITLSVLLDGKREIRELKKSSAKGAFSCPYCNETLILRSGNNRIQHFSHRHSESCELSIESERYHKQVERESKQHSVIKNFIYDELKMQQKLKKELEVEYGYLAKGAEKWSFYPDIIVKNIDKEIAITVLTNVTQNRDEKLASQIIKRNTYFKEKGLIPIWFIENTEQSLDLARHVIHLWEAELNLAMKTPEDLMGETLLNEITCDQSLFELFDYHHQNTPDSYKVRSLYYIQSKEDSIQFSVRRFIEDRQESPFRAFVLNEGYEISLSTALLATQTLQLSDPKIEMQLRDSFLQELQQKEKEYVAKQKEIEDTRRTELLIKHHDSSKRQDSSKNLLTKSHFRTAILEYIKTCSAILINTDDVTEYLVLNGASNECYNTGRYKIYPDVCACLDQLTEESIIELSSKGGQRNRTYAVKKYIKS
ncbi:competence protein CoiA family protein [Exiguobacterium aurantiacum]|uniref:Competence protein CoiA family protein n=1 Tax=Exiguobacterium aurantiacum TaxID=33987 RepID=A0ABY5FMA0_9BACL|nr:competence protein CoiA family protein [Exiguobacterium aurantiacum]UTT42578.1 competence protein CoiA family protein [Exiguobacterium aurantiacum]